VAHVGMGRPLRGSFNPPYRMKAELIKALEAMLLVGEHIDLTQGMTIEELFPVRFAAAREAIAKAKTGSRMTEDEKLKHCAGCHDNFYNQPGNSTTGRCWMLPKAKLVLKKEVHFDQVPPWNQKAEKFLDCFRRPRHVYVDPKQTC